MSKHNQRNLAFSHRSMVKLEDKLGGKMPQFFKRKSVDSKQILATVEEVKKQFTELSATINQLSQSVQHVHLAIQAYDNESGKSHDKMILEMLGKKTEEAGKKTTLLKAQLKSNQQGGK